MERPSTSVATEGRAVLSPQHRPLLHGDNEAWNILALLGANNGLKSLFNPLLQAVDGSLGVSGEEVPGLLLSLTGGWLLNSSEPL